MSKSKTMLVTGASGFIASNLIEKLLDDGFLVIATSRKKLKSRNKNLKYIKCNFNKIEPKYIKKCTFLIHAASTNTNNFNRNFTDTYETNVIHTMKLINTCLNYGIKKFLILGSCFEYGITGNKKKLLRINDMLLPHGYYSISKASLFLQLKYFLTTSKKKISVTYLRLFQVYGKYEKKNRLFPTVINAAKNDKKITINNSQAKRDFIDVKEVVDKSLKIFLNNKKRLHILNIGKGKATSIKNFAKKVWNKYSKKKSKLIFKNSHNYKLNNLIAKV